MVLCIGPVRVERTSITVSRCRSTIRATGHQEDRIGIEPMLTRLQLVAYDRSAICPVVPNQGIEPCVVHGLQPCAAPCQLLRQIGDLGVEPSEA